MDNVEKLATERVLKARSELIMARRFYGVLVSNVDPIITRNIPCGIKTAATNGKQHYFHPDFVATLSQAELLGTQVHESEHDARHHGTRRNGRDPVEWNKCCDYAINIDLIDQGFVLPKGALIDPRYRGMSAEDIYRTRELDRQREQQQQQQEQEQSEEDESEEGLDQADVDPPKPGEGDEDQEADDQPEDDADEGDGNGEGDGEPDQDGDEADEDGGQGGDDEDNHERESSSDAGQDDGDEGGDDGGENGQSEADGEGSDTQANGEGQGEPDDGEGSDTQADGGETGGKPSQGEFDGDMGQVLDAAPKAADMHDVDDRWERIARQAASIAKKAGQMPGHWSEEIDRRNQPSQDWREVLRAWIDQGARRIETWNRRNRRFSQVILPGSQRDGINTVAVVVDTSGSVDTVALAQVGAELQAALDERVIDKLVVVYNDTQVNSVQEYEPGDEFVLDAKGRGGTYLRPAFEWIAENVEDARLIICFTDMELMPDDLSDEATPEVPCLFAVHGYPQQVREYLANLPWDSVGIDVGEHIYQ